MAPASSRCPSTARGTLLMLILLKLCLAPCLSQTTELLGRSEPSTPTAVNKTVTPRPGRQEETSVTNRTSSRPSVISAPDADDQPCRRCLIAMVALAVVAGVFMVTTVALCSKVLNLPKVPPPQHCSNGMPARSSPTGSSLQGLWIEPAGTMKERSEFWYSGPGRRQQNGALNTGGTGENIDVWSQPAAPKVRTGRGARQNSLSSMGTDRHLLAPPLIGPLITLDQITDFWQKEGRSDNSSFKAVPSSRDALSEVGAESNSTEEQGSEFFQGSVSAEGPREAGDAGGGRQEEEEEMTVVQPRVTPEQISAFWKRGRAPEYTVQRGEVTLL